MNKKLTEVQRKIESLNSQLRKLSEEKRAAMQELKDSLDDKQAERVRMIDSQMSDTRQILSAALEREEELIEQQRQAQKEADLKELADMENQARTMSSDAMKEMDALLTKLQDIWKLAEKSDRLARMYSKSGFGGMTEFLPLLRLYGELRNDKTRLEIHYRSLGLS